ncbi:MAG: hypothetical protein K6F33_03645 [Bacteroidales bacterium]|nr:hypothetical protein [Bacteroidales bacterium]
MRKILLIMLLAVCSISAYSQDTKRVVYCEMMRFFTFRGVTISVDFGLKDMSIGGEYTELLDDNGNKFVSKIAAVNYMCRKGWTVFSFGNGDEKGSNSVVLYKTITDDKQILEGLNVKKND